MLMVMMIMMVTMTIKVQCDAPPSDCFPQASSVITVTIVTKPIGGIIIVTIPFNTFTQRRSVGVHLVICIYV